MPEYRYYATDILTGQVISDLPLYGVWCQRLLSKSGQFTGTFKLDTGYYDDTGLLEASEPGLRAVTVVRNGGIIWQGPLWSRTYSSQSKTCQLTGMTWESIFERVLLETDFIYTPTEQVTLFKNLIDRIQSQDGNNFGFDTTLVAAYPATGITREITLPAYEDHYASDALDNMIGVARGLDYTIEVQETGVLDQPKKVIRIGYPQLGNVSASPIMVYDYPGSITEYWYPESASAGGVKQATSGSGTSDDIKPRRRGTNTGLRAAGYPSWWQVNGYTHLFDQQAVDDRNAEDIAKKSIPVTVPTFTLKPDIAAGFDQWNALGDSFMVHIEDARFPRGKDIISRMIGWELSTADSDTSESLSLVIEGDDNA